MSTVSVRPLSNVQAAQRSQSTPRTQRIVLDAEQRMDRARVVRREGDAPTADRDVNSAYDHSGTVRDFFREVLNRESVDDGGASLNSIVHYGEKFNNAAWDGQRILLGDGDGREFKSFADDLTIIGHEIAHGVIQHTTDLAYRGQSGALNESWADVFGVVINQWAQDPKGFGTPEAAKRADWLVGAGILADSFSGKALRSMKAPGTANPKDPQPAHMRDYKKLPIHPMADYGGVHINSGIPNKAAYEVATRIGSEKLAKVWYEALVNGLTPHADFNDAARTTVSAAQRLYGEAEAQAVSDAWQAVGILNTTNHQSGVASPYDMPRKQGVPNPYVNQGVAPQWLAPEAASKKA